MIRNLILVRLRIVGILATTYRGYYDKNPAYLGPLVLRLRLSRGPA